MVIETDLLPTDHQQELVVLWKQVSISNGFRDVQW